MKQKNPNYLSYLDGLRGLAALYVVIHHAYMEVPPTALPHLAELSTRWLYYGQVSVDIFIVLSGYCLMLPVVIAGGSLRGGIGQYLLRRARRILPPYYIALLLSLILIAGIPGMNQISGTRWDVALPAIKRGAIGSHLLLLHNLNVNWALTINPPMWTVATECQIYFLFPLLLLPIWKRFGNLATIIVAFTLGLAPQFLFNQLNKQACLWFLGLFAMGMVAAVINFSRLIPKERLLRWSKAFCILGLIVFFAGTFVFGASRLWEYLYLMDFLVGLTISCFLVLCTGYCFNDAKLSHPFFLRFLMSPYVVRLGTFSYSLYLVHFPLLSLLHLWIRPLNLPPVEQLGFLLSVGTGVSLILAYIFYILFERPFMRSQPKIKA